jgi:hypothetical protein
MSFFNFIIIRHQFFFLTKHKTRIWSSENPHAFAETRLHPHLHTKVGVWIAASRRHLIAFIVKIKEPVINGSYITSALLFGTTICYKAAKIKYIRVPQDSLKIAIFKHPVCSFIDTLYLPLSHIILTNCIHQS